MGESDGHSPLLQREQSHGGSIDKLQEGSEGPY